MKIATIGAWGHLGRVLQEIDRAAPDARVVAMARAHPEEDPHRYKEAHRCTHAAPIFEQYQKMLDQVQPNVVVISTRLDLITPIALEAVARGCHLICEKPLALDVSSLRSLWDTCLKHKVQCLALLDNHVHPVIVATRTAVQDERLGRIAQFNVRKSYKWGTRPEWFARRSSYGGTIPWIGIHALDMVYSITNQAFVSIAAMHGNIAHPEYPDCEDSCGLLLKLRDGAIATASLDLLRSGAADTHGDDWIRVVGSHGTVEANMTRNTCTLTTSSETSHPLKLLPAAAAFVPFFRSIADGSLGTSPSAEMRRAFMLTHASLCARDAADRGDMLDIEDVYS